MFSHVSGHAFLRRLICCADGISSRDYRGLRQLSALSNADSIKTSRRRAEARVPLVRVQLNGMENLAPFAVGWVIRRYAPWFATRGQNPARQCDAALLFSALRRG